MPTAFSCSPVVGIDAVFPYESAQLDSNGIRQLGFWLTELRSQYSRYSLFDIDGHIAVNERGGKRLAESRANAIRDFLVRQGFSADRIHTESAGASYNIPQDGSPSNSTAIDFVPACPHACCPSSAQAAEDKGLPMP